MLNRILPWCFIHSVFALLFEIVLVHGTPSQWLLECQLNYQNYNGARHAITVDTEKSNEIVPVGVKPSQWLLTFGVLGVF